MIGTDRSVRVRRRAAAQVAVSIKRDDWIRYSDFPEHSLHSRIAHDRTDWSKRNRALLFVLRFRTFFYRQRFHAAQWGRNIELHYRHHAAILSPDERLLWIAGLWTLGEQVRECAKTKQRQKDAGQGDKQTD